MAPGGQRTNGNTQTQSTPSLSTSSNSSRMASTGAIRKGGGKKAENKALKNHFKQGGQRPRIEFSPDKKYPLGPWTQMWVTELGIICKQDIPLKRHKWKEVEPEEREILYKRVLTKFDVDLSQPHVLEDVNDSFSRIFKQYRHMLHKVYLDIPDGVDKCGNGPDYVLQDDWESLCDWFESDKFKKLSESHKGNRKCQKVNHRGGCKAFVRHRYEQKDLETNKEPSRIDFYFNMHYNTEKGWITPQAQANYIRNFFLSDLLICECVISYISFFEQEKMLELRSQPPVEGTPALTDDKIADKVLAVKSNYVLALSMGKWPHHAELEVVATILMLIRLLGRQKMLNFRFKLRIRQMNAQQRQLEDQGRMLEFLMSQHRNA